MNKKIIIGKPRSMRKSVVDLDKNMLDISKQVSMINQLYLDEEFEGKCAMEKALKKKLQSYVLCIVLFALRANGHWIVLIMI